MPTFSIPYGTQFLPLRIPESHWGEMLLPRGGHSLPFAATIQEAVNHPLQLPNLEGFLQGCRSLTVVINDQTRPTPSAKVLECLWPEIAPCLKRILVATGTHLPAGEESSQMLFGDLWTKVTALVRYHDCRKEKEMVYLGETSRGTRVLINQEIMMADRLLVIGSVEPHYFCGYTGGRKGIVPGLAAYSTIVANHSLALDLEAQPLRLQGNPVHEDLEEALQLLTMPPVFSLMLVQTAENDLYAAYGGSLQQTLFPAARKADEIYAIPFTEKADILVSVVFPPLDLDLYQCQKPIEHGKMALKEDGILILVMACPQGPGPKDFQDLLLETGDSKKARLLLYQPYQLGFHRIIRNIKFLEQGGEVWGITGVDEGLLSRTFIRPMPSLQEAVDKAISLKGKSARVHILLNSALGVPKNQ
ncbi:MAG: nickel-dependent lactate racemase [Thermodesulfobacteriota bacterium]